MAMMIVVKNTKNARMTDYDPEIQHTNILYIKVIGAQNKALLVCKAITDEQARWKWKGMKK